MELALQEALPEPQKYVKQRDWGLGLRTPKICNRIMASWAIIRVLGLSFCLLVGFR